MDILTKLKQFQIGNCEKGYVKMPYEYENEYLRVVRVDSSNKWLSDKKMAKQWSIVCEIKKDYTNLVNFKVLQQNFCVKNTPVSRGEFTGLNGIRFYGMSKNPTTEIVKEILDFVFENKKTEDEIQQGILQEKEELDELLVVRKKEQGEKEQEEEEEVGMSTSCYFIPFRKFK